MKPKRTDKQRIIMKVIFDAAGQGEFLNVRQIHARLPYTCAYGSLRRSLEHLEKHGAIVKERSGMCVLVKPTQIGYAWFSSGAVS